MDGEHDAPDEWPPLLMPDGRVFGVPFIRVSNYSDNPEVLWTCNAAFVQRGIEYSYWEFHINFYRTAFEREAFTEDAEALADFVRDWIFQYFIEHHTIRPVHLHNVPIRKDFR